MTQTWSNGMICYVFYTKGRTSDATFILVGVPLLQGQLYILVRKHEGSYIKKRKLGLQSYLYISI